MRELGDRTEPPAVTAYTITYRQPARLALTLADLLSQDYPPDRMEIVVLDDGSEDETLDVLRSCQTAARVSVQMLSVEHVRDYHSSLRWNQCLGAASPTTSVFIQLDDVRLRPDFIHQHVKWHLGGHLRLVTGAMFEGPNADPSWSLDSCRRRGLSLNGDPAPCSFVAVWGPSMSFRRELMEKVMAPPHENPYDERMCGWGWHEVELAYRMQQAGADLVYDPAAGVYHQFHSQRNELAQRGLDRAAEVVASGERNERYLRQKHRLDRLPWWPT